MRIFLATLALLLPIAAHAACPEQNVYPFVDGCPLTASNLNNAFAMVSAAAAAAESVASTAATTVNAISATKMNKDGSDATLPSARLNLLPAPTNGYVLTGNGADWTAQPGGGGGGTPAGSTNDIQINSSGVFGALTPGTGVATALAVGVGSAGGFVKNNGDALSGTFTGTPIFNTLTSDTIKAANSASASHTIHNSGTNTDVNAPTGGNLDLRVGNTTIVRSTAAGASMQVGTLTNLPTPTNATDAANKAYVDSLAAGVVVLHSSVAAATTANLNATHAGAGVGATLTNAGAQAAFSTDGVSPPINARVLVKDQTLTQYNGLYTLTTVGSGAANWVLTRAVDFDQASAAEVTTGAAVLIVGGTTNGSTLWLQTGQGPFTVDTTPIIWDLVDTGAAGLNGTVSSGTASQLAYYASGGTTVGGLTTGNNGVLVTNGSGVPSISSTIPTATQSNITQVGTLSSGTLTGATGLPVSTGISGLGTGVATALGVNTGSAGAMVLLNGALGTPSSGTLTNATGLPFTGVTGVATGAQGGTGVANTGKTLTLGATATSLPAAPGSTQCLHMTTGGAITTTGADCGSGGGTGMAFNGSDSTSAALGNITTNAGVGRIYAHTFAGADMCAKIVAAAASAFSLYPAGAVIDATGFNGNQNCAGGMFASWPGNNFDVLLSSDVLLTTSKTIRVPQYTKLYSTAGAPNNTNTTGARIRPKHGSFETVNIAVNASGCSGNTINVASTAALTALSHGGVGYSITGNGIPTSAGPVMVQATTGTTISTTATVTCANTNSLTFTAPIVAIGDTNISFRSKVENISATCIDDTGVAVAAGTIGMQNVRAQEQSWFRNTYVGICQYQYVVEGLGIAAADPQNSGPYRDVHGQSPSSLITLNQHRCWSIGNGIGLTVLTAEFNNISCDSGNATSSAAILVDAAGVVIRNGNIENALDGILIGSRRTSHAIRIENITCGTGVTTNCVHLSNTVGSDTVTIDGVWSAVATNVMKDDQTNGCTITGANMGSSFAGVQYWRAGNNKIMTPAGAGVCF